MESNGMLICSFYLKERFSSDTLFPLNTEWRYTTDEGDIRIYKNALDMFQYFCNENDEFSDDETNQKMFSTVAGSVQSYDETTYTAMSFVIKSGSYGVVADMTNRHTKEVSYHRNIDEAQIKEFACIIYIPKDVSDTAITKGIMIFQSISTYGVKTITSKHMKAYFASLGLTLETRSVSVSAFIDKLISQGHLYKITLIRNRLSPNPADNMLISAGREETSYFRPTLHQKWLQKLLSIFDTADKTGVYEIPAEEDFDDISIQFKLGDKTRSVRLKYIDRYSIVEDIPDGIVGQNDNTAIIKYMIETADAYRDRIIFVRER